MLSEDFFNSFESQFGIKLNDEQREAVLNEDEVLQIIAGAGTGKTTTLVAKVKYLIEVKNASKCEYMRDSFYKMFGYIYDFSSINNLPDINFTENILFVLVNWNGCKIDENFKEEIFN